MSRVFIFLFCIVLAFSCKKKKEDDPVPEPEPIKTGTVNITVLTYDSLGGLENDYSGVNVSLYHTGFSAVTNAAGQVSFNNVPYGDLLPVLQKKDYEGAPLLIPLSINAVSAVVPCAKYSTYKLQNLSGFIVNPDSIAISFSLDRPIPAGKVCKIAVLFSDTTINPGNPGAIDTLHISSQVVQKLNIANLPNLKTALIVMKKNRSFHISAVPVSYGLYFSNAFGRQVLIGENPFFPNELVFNKNW